MIASLDNEFQLDAFAKYYRELSDSFIDIRGAADSLKKLIQPKSTIFEIGLGTGYFAAQFRNDEYQFCGIQPRDQMLQRLKEEQPNVVVLAEEKLEDYTFDRQYDVIVSHSSVFLFTKHQYGYGDSGEVTVSLVFQSFIRDPQEVYHNLNKVLGALSPQGRLFVNVQRNPYKKTVVGPPEDQFVFEMTQCSYYLDFQRVEKTFLASYRNYTHLINDTRYCSSWSDLVKNLASMGAKLSWSDDGQWVILEKPTA